jgi:hypothetical protein
MATQLYDQLDRRRAFRELLTPYSDGDLTIFQSVLSELLNERKREAEHTLMEKFWHVVAYKCAHQYQEFIATEDQRWLTTIFSEISNHACLECLGKELQKIFARKVSFQPLVSSSAKQVAYGERVRWQHVYRLVEKIQPQPGEVKLSYFERFKSLAVSLGVTQANWWLDLKDLAHLEAVLLCDEETYNEFASAIEIHQLVDKRVPEKKLKEYLEALVAFKITRAAEPTKRSKKKS